MSTSALILGLGARGARPGARARRLGPFAGFVALACLGAWAVWRSGAAAGTRGSLAADAPYEPPPSVHAIGRLEPRGTALRLAAPTAVDGTRVERLLAAEGDAVAEGDVVAVLDTEARRRAALVEAEARLSAAHARLDQIKAGAKASDVAAQAAAVARSSAALRNAEVDLRRTEALARRGVSAAEELESVRLRFDSARLDREQAEATLRGLTEVREVDLRLQGQEILAAEAAVARARAELDAASIRSPGAGRVLRVHARPGEKIGELGLLELGDTEVMYAVAEVYEADVPRVRAGQPAVVRLVSSGVGLAGEVERVGLLVGRKDVHDNDPVSDTDARVVEVRVRLAPGDGRKVAGLSNARVGVTIDVD